MHTFIHMLHNFTQITLQIKNNLHFTFFSFAFYFFKYIIHEFHNARTLYQINFRSYCILVHAYLAFSFSTTLLYLW
jgi:hypothetical protein